MSFLFVETSFVVINVYLQIYYVNIECLEGMVTGMRGLCNGLGPAMFGIIFSIFHVDLTDADGDGPTHTTDLHEIETYSQVSLDYRVWRDVETDE